MSIRFNSVGVLKTLARYWNPRRRSPGAASATRLLRSRPYRLEQLEDRRLLSISGSIDDEPQALWAVEDAMAVVATASTGGVQISHAPELGTIVLKDELVEGWAIEREISPAIPLPDSPDGTMKQHDWQSTDHGSSPPGAEYTPSFTVTLKKGPNLLGDPDASAAFDEAAGLVEAMFEDPIEIVVDAEMASMSPGVLGSSSSVSFSSGYDSATGTIRNDANPFDEAIVAGLPTSAQASFTLPNDPANPFSLSGNVSMTRANLLAVGVDPGWVSTGPDSAYDPTVKRDMSLTFNSDYTFDYDRSDGISAGTIDFIGVAVHEILHGLGFTSNVDLVDFLLDNPGYSRAVSPDGLDLFRLTPGAGASNFTTASRVMAPGDYVANQTFYDGGVHDFTAVGYAGMTVGDIPMATGTSHGDGTQASHWKDNSFLPGGINIGLMDPIIYGSGVQVDAESTDVRALGLVGWNVPDAGRSTIYQTDFSGGLPAGWSVDDGGASSDTWTSTNPGGRSNTNWDGTFMIVDSDNAGSVDMDEALVSTTIDCSSYEDVALEFTHYYATYTGADTAEVDVRVGAGAWQTVKTFQGADAYGTLMVDISSIADGQSDVQVRWHYYDANYEWYWGVDNVEVTGVEQEAELDFGDAPDTGPGTGTGNYNTLSTDNGPSHVTGANVFMGTAPDAEAEAFQSTGADGDDNNGSDDEDGLVDPAGDLTLLVGEVPTVNFVVTNNTGTNAFLFGWIDYNGDGVFDDVTELTGTYVYDGSTDATVTLSFPQVPAGFTGTTYARFRLSTDPALASATGPAYDGEVEDYVVDIQAWDFGDAPDDGIDYFYPTLSANNGASHDMVEPSLYLGAGVDADPDGQPSAAADGDDVLDGNDDEDGVTFTSALVGGLDTTVDIVASGTGLLNAWLDLNGDGDWDDSGEQIFTDESLSAGLNTRSFAVPANSMVGDTFARFRFSTQAGLSFEGHAPDGEVEDYRVPIEGIDFGDAPDPSYPTLLPTGARHQIDPTLFLGAGVVSEADGQPDPNALGDDNDGNDDEDGVRFTSALVAGAAPGLEVAASGAGLLNAWVDFNDNGSWADPGEQIFTDLPLVAGMNRLSFVVPAAATITEQTFARFRFSTQAGLSYEGYAPDGEVEDYEVEIIPFPTTGLDFGDAPDTGPGTGTGNYNTLSTDNGPRHSLGAILFMGTPDAELEAIPSTKADGDDNNYADDEDGLVDPIGDLSLVVGQSPSVDVRVTNNTGSTATLYGWIDYNGDGVFHAFERRTISVPNVTNNQVVTLSFPAVPSGFTGRTFARFRLSTDAAAASPTGLASNGEVEDYPVTIASSTVASIVVDHHLLRPGELDQEVDVYAVGSINVAGLNCNVQVADGGTEMGQTYDGPEIQDLVVINDLASGVPIPPEYIFDENNTGTSDLDGPWPYPTDAATQFEVRSTTTPLGTVTANGLLGTITIATVDSATDPYTPYTGGTWDLFMSQTLNGATEFAGVAADITDGTITVSTPPEAVPGSGYSVPEGGSIGLDGSGSYDPEESFTWESPITHIVHNLALDSIVLYEWDLDQDGIFGETGPSAERGDEVGPNPTFSAAGLDGDDDSPWTVYLRVTDTTDLTSVEVSTDIDITNVAPTVEAGDDQTVDEGQLVSLDPASFDDDGVPDTHTAVIDWGDGTWDNGTVDQDADTVSGSHVYADNGVYTGTLTVTDDEGASASDTITVTVQIGRASCRERV